VSILSLSNATGKAGRRKEKEMEKRKYYIGESYMGVDFTYSSGCWRAFAFDTKAGRDKYLEDYEYKDGKLVAEAVTRKQAIEIAKGEGKSILGYNIVLDHACRAHGQERGEDGEWQYVDYGCIGEVVDSYERNFERL
jgi:hypothetical protein